MSKHRARSQAGSGRHASRRRAAPDREAHREERRTELLDAAVDAIKRHGPGASMSQIAAAAGVTKPILYRHIGGRDEVVAALTERFVGQINDRLRAATEDTEAHPRDLLAAGIDAYLELIEHETDVYRFLLRNAGETPGGVEILSRVLRQIGATAVFALGERARQAGADSGAAEPWGYGIVGMVHAAGDWWLEQRTMSRAALTEYLVTLVWDGMASVVPDDTAESGGAG